MQHWRDTMFHGIKVTDEQAAVLDAIFDPEVQIVFINAGAGVGKTTLAVGAANIMQLPLLYWFAPVYEGKQGFLPGDLEGKNAPYLAPLKKALKKINQNPMQAIYSAANATAKFGQKPWVFPDSDTYLRGDDIEESFVVFDEAQNWTHSQLIKGLTRLHDDCKAMVIGHTKQCDLDDPTQSGFETAIEHFRSEPYVRVLDLTKNFRGRLSQHADKMPRSRYQAQAAEIKKQEQQEGGE